MTDPLISETAFRWMLSILTVAGSAWALFDIVKMSRLPRGASDPLTRDKRFGYWVGIAVGALGIAGVLKFNGVF